MISISNWSSQWVNHILQYQTHWARKHFRAPETQCSSTRQALGKFIIFICDNLRHYLSITFPFQLYPWATESGKFCFKYRKMSLALKKWQETFCKGNWMRLSFRMTACPIQNILKQQIISQRQINNSARMRSWLHTGVLASCTQHKQMKNLMFK